MRSQSEVARWLRRLLVGTLLAMVSVTSRATPAEGQGIHASPTGSSRLILIGTADVRQFDRVDISFVDAPFVSNHVQLGVAASGQWFKGSQGSSSYGGSIGGLGNFYFGRSSRSRPYLGAYAALTGNTGIQTFTTLGVQAGWLYFLTPGAALRLEYRYRDYSRVTPPTREVILYLDPYVGGRATALPRAPARFGSWDVFLRGYADPTRDGQWNGRVLVAPFLARWFQLGAVFDYVYFAGFDVSAHQIEGFGRLYAPIDGRIVPFAGAFAEAGTFSNDNSGLSTYGPFAGVRLYLHRDAALDLSIRQTRHTTLEFGGGRFRLNDEFQLHVGVVTQLRLSH